MVFEKKLIILTGDGGAKGTLKTERNAYGLKCDINAFNIAKKSDAGYILAVKEGEQVKEYPLGVSLDGGKEILLSEKTDVPTAHFVIYEAGGDALLYGTLNRNRLWKGNLPNGRKREVYGEKDAIDEVKSNKAEKEEFRFSKRSETFLDIFPSEGGYDDNAVAAVNYYAADFGKNALTDESSISAEADAKPEPRPEDNALKEDKAKAEYNEQGIRVEYMRGAKPEGDEKLRISDLQYAFLRDYEQKVNAELKAESESGSASHRTEALSGTAGEKPVKRSLRNSVSSGVNVFMRRMDALSKGSSVLVPSVSEENEAFIRGRELSYYEQVSDQIEKLFTEGTRETELESLMPHTKWVRVDFSGDGRFYVVGLVGDKPDYICYGLPADYTPEPPDEISGYCGWLPLDVRNPQGKGYWLLYQDADTGESVTTDEMK